MSKRKAIKVPKAPSPLLPTECMEQIFKHVLEMESARLHPSLLVNRYWCKNVVPFLWTRPFALVSNQDCYKLLRTFLLCLDSQEHNLLNCLLKPYKIKIPSSNKRTTFNYPIYMQELSLKDLEVCIASTIHKWYGKSSYDGYYPYQMEILINSLLRLFFRGSTNLRFLNFNQYFNFLDILDSTELFSQTQYGLSQLTRLQIVNNEPITRNTIHFLKLLSITCKQIHSLEIRLQSFDYSTEVINHFTNLITSQRDLMEFSIANIMINFEQIMSSLQSHKICLHSIKLDCVYLTEGSMNLLNNFHNLESLYLYYCEGLTSTLLEGHFNLQNLHIINSLKLQNVTLSMLQVYGNSLRQLGLNIHDLEVSGDMAFECCQNINELVLIIYNPTHLSGYDTWKTEKWKERLDTLILTQKINLSTLSIRDQTI